jgi:hypothetical protein
LKFAYKCPPFLSFFIYRKKSYRKEKQGADLPFFKRRRPTLVLAIAVIQRVCFPLQISDQRICCKMSTFLLIFVYMCFYCEHEASSGEICCCDALHLTATCTKHGQILTVSVPHMVSNSLTLTTTQACRLRRVGRRSRSHQQSEEKQKAEQSKDLTYPITDTWIARSLICAAGGFYLLRKAWQPVKALRKSSARYCRDVSARELLG